MVRIDFVDGNYLLDCIHYSASHVGVRGFWMLISLLELQNSSIEEILSCAAVFRTPVYGFD